MLLKNWANTIVTEQTRKAVLIYTGAMLGAGFALGFVVAMGLFVD